MRRSGFVAVMVLVVAACTSLGSQVDSPNETAPTTNSTVESSSTVLANSTTEASSTTLADATLVVRYVQEASYVEGSVVHVELFRYFPGVSDIPRQIAIVDENAPEDGTVLVDVAPAPGSYELRSYQLPRRGDFNVFGSPSDGCAVRLSLKPGIAAEAVLTVRPGSTCDIDVEGANVDVPELNMDLTMDPIGASGCDPASPRDNGGLTEVLATSTRETVAWGLLWEEPPLRVNVEIKMVFRLTGSGPFNVVARHEDGTEITPSWGPNDHGMNGSNYGRAGNEWGLAFTFPHSGCWDIHLTRGADSADVWVRVGDQ